MEDTRRHHHHHRGCVPSESGMGHGHHGRGHGGGIDISGPWSGRSEAGSVQLDAGERDRAMFGEGRGRRGPRRGHEFEGFGFEKGRGRPERPFEQGDIRWLVLDLISGQPRHGYEIIKAIEDMMAGHYAPSPGIIYPTLTFLEETGLIASEAQAARKLYTITEEGTEALKANSGSLQAIRARIEETRARFGADPAPEMKRAMHNLRMAIQVRLSKGELSRDSLAAITTALDRAAGEIERS